ncbi:MAG: serine/threonine-protein phosphatase [Deltaproteobacteria bacterium]|nr:serine/threonine-protein phosphatase [Deltaproteobacteria bacterium]MBW1948662.1 serine/threonine-protein phosphatase [Deltaproteobacteria bacterium]MBW2007236.1 serine/threonine-protein phosphatase [Deltaproteobacteria bacterium]MBW2347642.1 serine/threonine-protein phosphatase [Deltaproteobacteria bacterium]
MKTGSRDIGYCVKSHRGLKRSQNEDSHVVLTRIWNTDNLVADAGSLFAVADGISGKTGGRIASKMAIEGLRERYSDREARLAISRSRRPDEIMANLEKAFFAIHEEISRLAHSVVKYEHMGTTLSVLILTDNMAYIAHVGDSRIYLLRDCHLKQLTRDDTIAQLSVEMGYLQADEAQGHPLSHALVQALGQGVDDLYTKKVGIQSGDVFLLCSDGLYDMISEGQITEILQTNTKGNTPCDSLIEAALENGGKDNVTVIVVNVP